LVEAARLAAGALPPEQRVAMATLLELAGRKLEGARQAARNIRGADPQKLNRVDYCRKKSTSDVSFFICSRLSKLL
jgi:hypothetical protein